MGEKSHFAVSVVGIYISANRTWYDPAAWFVVGIGMRGIRQIRRDHRPITVAGGVEIDSARTSVWYSLRAYPGYRVLFNSTLATNSAFVIWQMALGWLALVLTDSAFYVGLTGFLGGIPMLFVTLPAGVLIDRMDRRKILLIAQSVVTVVSTILAVLLLLDRLAIWHMLAASFVTGGAMAVVFPVRSALIANLVPPKHIANAVALASTAQNAPRVVGPALAGALISLLGLSGTFFACMALQILAMIITLRLPRTATTPLVARRSMIASISEGLAVIRRSQYLLGIFILAVVPIMFIMPFTNLLPVFARDVLGIGSAGLGWLLAANGLGALAGSIWVAGAPQHAKKPGVLVWSTVAFGCSVIAFAAIPNPIIAGLLVLIAGLTSAIYIAVNNTQIQLSVHDSVRGRVLGVYLFTWGLQPIGVLPVGIAADAVGAPLAVASLAFIGLVLTVLTVIRFPALRGSTMPTPEAQEPLPQPLP